MRNGIAVIALLVAAGPASAGSATSRFSVSASVSHNCTITTASISFGTYDPVATHATGPLDGQGSVIITCTRGALPITSLSAGVNSASAVGTTRAMRNGSDYLSYEIYLDSGRSRVWFSSGAGLFTPVAAPNTSPRTFPTYGRIPAGQHVPAGPTYTDTVTATVNF